VALDAQLGIGAPEGFAKPLWLGETPLAGKTILLHGRAGSWAIQ
jgi:hypothetical protein